MIFLEGKSLVQTKTRPQRLNAWKPSDLTFTTKKAAEERALDLCRAWIDEQSSESISRSKGSANIGQQFLPMSIPFVD
jgi:hypothetical protein